MRVWPPPCIDYGKYTDWLYERALVSTMVRSSLEQESSTMGANESTFERIDLRTSPEVKELIVRAASTAGMTVSAFLLGTAQERAKAILSEAEMVTLSARDWDAFAKSLDKTEKVRPKLAAAMARHREWRKA